MAGYILRRLGSAIVVLWAVMTVTFFLMHAIPGGPFTAEKKLPAGILQTIEERYHLNDSVGLQYIDYMKRAVVLDFGPSYKYLGRSVNDIITESFPVSATLGLLSLAVAVGVGIPAGTIAAWRKNSWVDYTTMLGATFGMSVPSFIIAAVLVNLFAFHWQMFPAALWKGPLYMILPTISLAAHPTAFITRLTRSSMLEVLNQDYMKTARSKGVGTFRPLCYHGLRNALLPVISYIGPLSAALLTGSFIVENIFAIPGLGRHFVTSIYNRDYTVILGVTIFYSVIVVAMNLIVDLLYPLLDPRITLRGGTEGEK